MPFWDASPESYSQPESVSEQQVLCNRVAHALATNDGRSVGLPGPIDGSTARRCTAIVTNERRASYVIPLNSS